MHLQIKDMKNKVKNTLTRKSFLVVSSLGMIAQTHGSLNDLQKKSEERTKSLARELRELDMYDRSKIYVDQMLNTIESLSTPEWNNEELFNLLSETKRFENAYSSEIKDLKNKHDLKIQGLRGKRDSEIRFFEAIHNFEDELLKIKYVSDIKNLQDRKEILVSSIKKIGISESSQKDKKEVIDWLKNNGSYPYRCPEYSLITALIGKKFFNKEEIKKFFGMLDATTKKNNWEIWEAIQETFPDLLTEFVAHKNIWHRAAELNYPGAIKFAFKIRANIDAINSKRETPFCLAVKNGNVDVVKVIIEKIDLKDAQALLFLAVKNGNKDIIELFINKGVNINEKNFKGQTPLHLAAENGHKDIVKILIDKSVNINEKDIHGQTPLHLAAENGHKGIVKIFIDKSVNDKGVNINEKNFKGQTPLHLAVKNGHKDIVKILIDKGVNINEKDIHGQTPLHLAIANILKDNESEILKFLIDNGADETIEDDNKKVALDCFPLQVSCKPVTIKDLLDIDSFLISLKRISSTSQL